jgi:hypothetical protein
MLSAGALFLLMLSASLLFLLMLSGGTLSSSCLLLLIGALSSPWLLLPVGGLFSALFSQRFEAPSTAGLLLRRGRTLFSAWFKPLAEALLTA